LISFLDVMCCEVERLLLGRSEGRVVLQVIGSGPHGGIDAVDGLGAIAAGEQVVVADAV
jgi:hypothetical protein